MQFASNATALPDDTPEARRYNRVRRWLGIADLLLGLLVLLVLLLTGWSRSLRDIALAGAFEHYSLALLLYVFLLMIIEKGLGEGLDYYGFRLEHRYNLSNQRFRSWIWDQCKAFLVGFVLAAIVAEVLYYTIRQSPEHWWLIAWVLFMGLFILMAQLAPVLLMPVFYKFEPLENEELKQRLVRLSERAGTRVRGVYQWKLSEKSKKANAALTGLGRTRRIILADTLLDNYSGDEIEAVLAHELGHHVHKHIFKSILVQAGTTLLGFWVASLVLREAVDRGGTLASDFANLPLLVLVATVVSFLLMPALNAFSRYNERQADRYAFRSIPSIRPFVTSMNKLADQNLAERAPSPCVEWFFHSHPSISKRVAAAETWAAKN